MIRFYDDYSEGVHPELLAALSRGNDEQQQGYGEDDATARAAERIRRRFDVDADVHFVSGATQANLVTLATMLRPYEGVIAPSTGHIAVHETGAIEATGHKVLTVDTPDGRLTPALLDEALLLHQDEHTVLPGAVFLTQSTETGTVYTRDGLAETVCAAKRAGLRVFLDGARLAMALASAAAGMRPEDLGRMGVDAFTVGGTKVGGMFGEAIVLLDPDLRRHFRYSLKQRGALLAKGRFLGVQFERFFADDDLWLGLGAQANATAARLGEGLAAAGVKLAGEVESNAVFAVLPQDVIDAVSPEYGFYVWERRGPDEAVVRLMCSWATPAERVDALVARIGGSLR